VERSILPGGLLPKPGALFLFVLANMFVQCLAIPYERILSRNSGASLTFLSCLSSSVEGGFSILGATAAALQRGGARPPLSTTALDWEKRYQGHSIHIERV
jgi:hypothetical protein